MVHQRGGSIATQQENLRGLKDPPGQGTYLIGIEAVMERMQVLHVPVQRSPYERRRACPFPLCRLQSIERRRIGHRQIMQVPLEIFVRRKTQALDDSNSGRWICAQ